MKRSAKSAKKSAKPKTTKPKQKAKAKPKRRAADRALRCPGCRVELKEMGVVELREGGSSGATTALFGGLAEISEGQWLLERYECPRCRVVTLREPKVEMVSFE